jgi:carboxylesterase type B
MRPEQVWIHGGGFNDFAPAFGIANGTNLVLKSVAMGTPVVIVSVNYRLGGLGYMGLADLARESGAHGSSGNYGMLDQVYICVCVCLSSH